MAESEVPDPRTGPFVRAALICERMLEEKDGVLTPVRVIDRFSVQAQGAEAPATMPPSKISFVIFVSLAAGDARGGTNLSLRLEPPSVTDARMLWEGTLDFHAGPDQTQNLVLHTNVDARSAGLYWIDVLVEGRRATRIPLRVSYPRTLTRPS